MSLYALTKKCTECREEKPLEAFHAEPRVKSGKRTRCVDCDASYLRQWRVKNTAKCAEYKMKSRCKNYNITPEEYATRLKSQDYKCAICKDSQPGPKKTNFCIDHCKVTGKVRGLLCVTCNQGIGLLGDTFDDALNAARYLCG